MATIADVARMSNVSMMTVSRALNNKNLVSQKTYENILRSIEALSYVPNHAARSLVLKSNKSIALLITSVANPYYGRVMEGIEKIAEGKGYSVLLINANQQEKYPMCIDNIISRGVGGVICSHLNLGQVHLDKLVKHNIRCVLIDNEQDVLGIPSIKSDHRYGASLAVEHLIGLGHKRIAFIHGNLGDHHSNVSSGGEENYSFRLWQGRYDGYISSMHKHNLEIPEGYIVKGGSSFELNVQNGVIAMEKLMDLPYPPTAVYAGNDLFAIGALNAVLHRCKNVPKDFSIVGHGGIDATQYTNPVLTSVKQPRFEIGCHAASTLIGYLENDGLNKTFHEIEIIKPSLIMGDSTCSLPMELDCKEEEYFSINVV